MKWNDRTYRNLTRFGCYTLALGLCVFFAIAKPKDFSPTWFGAVALLLVYAGVIAGAKPASRNKESDSDKSPKDDGTNGVPTLSAGERRALEAWARIREHAAAAAFDQSSDDFDGDDGARSLRGITVGWL